MNTTAYKDQIFAEPLQSVASFSFDARVADVFDDMIERSVPGYRSIVTQTGLLAQRFARQNTCCYDLGCSLGASTFAMRQQLNAGQHKIIAIDNSKPMLERMQARLQADSATVPVELKHADISTMDFADPCSVAVLNFTLQFLAPQHSCLLYTSPSPRDS